MPLAQVKELHSGRDFDSSPDDRQYTRVYQARATQRHDEGFVIQAASAVFDLPVIGSPYSEDPDARCITAKGSNSSGPFIWILTYGFSSSREARKLTENPLEDPVEFTWADVFESELTNQDSQGIPMLNSAGDTFDNPVSIDRGKKRVTLKFNLSGIDPLPSWFFEYPSNSTNKRRQFNDAAIVIDQKDWPELTVEFESVSASPVKVRNDIKYREISTNLLTGQSPFIERIDEGFRQRVITVGEPRGVLEPILNTDGSGLRKPVLLDGQGGVLADPKPEDAVLLKFGMNSSADFTVIRGVEPAP